MQYDEGGPLSCNNKLAGLVSWGMSYGNADYPHVYVNVAFYRQWIQNKINSDNPPFLPSLPPIDAGDDEPVTAEPPVPATDEPVAPINGMPILTVYVKVLGWRFQYESKETFAPSLVHNIVRRFQDKQSEDEDSPLFHVRVMYRQHKFEYKTKWQWNHHGLLESLIEPLAIEF